MKEQLSLSFDWLQIDHPSKGWGYVPTSAAIYRLEFTHPVLACYIGETKNLRSRIRQHRTGSGTPITVLRPRWVTSEQQGEVRLFIADKIRVDGRVVRDLSFRINRLFIESAGVMSAMRRADMVLLNTGHL